MMADSRSQVESACHVDGPQVSKRFSDAHSMPPVNYNYRNVSLVDLRANQSCLQQPNAHLYAISRSHSLCTERQELLSPVTSLAQQGIDNQSINPVSSDAAIKRGHPTSSDNSMSRLKWDDVRRWNSSTMMSNTLLRHPLPLHTRTAIAPAHISVADTGRRRISCENETGHGIVDGSSSLSFASNWITNEKNESTPIVQPSYSTTSAYPAVENDNGSNSFPSTNVNFNAAGHSNAGNDSRMSALSGGVPLYSLPSHTKPPHMRTRSSTLTELERRERHNAHTRSSRLRIDQGIRKLSEALKKARPGLKLTKKADIVIEAVNYILENCQLKQTESCAPVDLHNSTLPS